MDIRLFINFLKSKVKREDKKKYIKNYFNVFSYLYAPTKNARKEFRTMKVLSIFY